MASILCVGDEPALNRSRAAVLRTTGCDVTESGSSGALLLLHTHPFDMVLLCHTVPAETFANITNAAKHLAKPPQIVVIDSPFGTVSPAPDGVLRIDPFEGPRLLAEKVCHSLDVPAPFHPSSPAKPVAAAMPIASIDFHRHADKTVLRRQ
jgi:hypothetical protein